MRLLQTLLNIFRIEDLRKRILTTIFFVLVYRLGSFVILPGIDPQNLTHLQEQTSSGLLALLDMFSGGAFSHASIFALGIMPYISASIIMQLAAIAIPSIQKMQREGESGRRKIDQWTRYMTIAILLIQAPTYLINLNVQLHSAGAVMPQHWAYDVLWVLVLTAGSMFVLWLGERITDKGIGNGVSFIILIGIIARLPHAFAGEFIQRMGSAAGGLVAFLAEIVFLLFVMAAAILLVQGTRRVPVQYAKRVIGNRQYGGARQYIPLKVNAANVMPIIFAQAIMFIPISLWGLATNGKQSGFMASFMDFTSVSYNVTFAIMILLFTYFYTAITINPTQMADDLKRNNGFIPGIKPGKATRDYLDLIMDRITLPGAIFLAVVAILPAFAKILGISSAFSQFFGGTSLLILVGVILDTLQQIESHLLMHHYDGLLKTGKIKGRTGSISAY